ncbi:hypothetical protein SCG7109_BC_00080, partial [Chlamydiales bacterium SCGC AG-110-M15]
LDLMDFFVTQAKHNFAHDDLAHFDVFDAVKSKYPDNYDHFCAVGIFNNRNKNEEEFLFSTVEKMYLSAKKSVAFNAMSKYVDYFDEDLYYADPLKVFDFCKKAYPACYLAS